MHTSSVVPLWSRCTYIGSEIVEDEDARVDPESSPGIGREDEMLVPDEGVDDDAGKKGADPIEKRLKGRVRGIVGGDRVEASRTLPLKEVAVVEESRL